MALVGIAVQLGITAGLYGISKFMEAGGTGPSTYRKPQPEGLEFAQNTIGDSIPIIYGTVRIDSPFLAWYSQTNSLVSGTYYYDATLLLVAGVPPYDKYTDPDNPASEVAPYTTWRSTWPPKWIDTWWGDMPDVGGASGSITHAGTSSIAFNLQNENDVGGNVFFTREFWDGRADQVITSYPAAPTNTIDTAINAVDPAMRSLVPGYRHQALCVLSSTTSIGSNPRLPAISVEIQALGPAPIGGLGAEDANPAWVLWDLICSPVWKVGYDQARVDVASFQAAATTLENEDHGISLAVYQVDDAARVLLGVLAQINGLLFEDPTSGKLKLKLIRNDYVLASLPVMNTDNTIGKPEITIVGWRETTNSLRVKFTDRSKRYQKNWAQAFRLATDAGYNPRLKPREIEFTGCMTEALAQVLADREIAEVSRPFATATVKLTREFYDLLPGDPVLGNWPQLGIVNKVFRVLNVDYGQLADGGITVQLVEDVHAGNQAAVPPWGGVLDPEF